MMSCLRERARFSRPTLLRELEQFRNRVELELSQVHRPAARLELGRADDVEVLAVHEVVGRQLVLTAGRDFRPVRRDRRACWAGCGPGCPGSLSQLAVQEGRDVGLADRADLLALGLPVLEQDQCRDARGR